MACRLQLPRRQCTQRHRPHPCPSPLQLLPQCGRSPCQAFSPPQAHRSRVRPAALSLRQPGSRLVRAWRHGMVPGGSIDISALPQRPGHPPWLQQRLPSSLRQHQCAVLQTPQPLHRACQPLPASRCRAPLRLQHALPGAAFGTVGMPWHPCHPPRPRLHRPQRVRPLQHPAQPVLHRPHPRKTCKSASLAHCCQRLQQLLAPALACRPPHP